MRGKWPLAAGIVVLLAVVSGLVTMMRQEPARPKPAPTPLAPPAADISLSGRVQARKIVEIAVPIDGIVERFMADVGEDVFQGELLARIRNAKVDTLAKTTDADAQRAQARVGDLSAALGAARLEASRSRADAIRAKAEFDRAEKAYLRQQLLFKEGATPRLVFEKAETEYNKAKADNESFGTLASTAEDRAAALAKESESARSTAQAKAQQSDEAKADLGAGEVHSPVDGVVVARHGRAGEQVSRDVRDLFQIGTDLGSLEVVLTPDSQLLPRIRAGQQAWVRIADTPGAIPGLVREVKSGQVFVDFASPLPAIKPGLTAQVTIKP